MDNNVYGAKVVGELPIKQFSFAHYDGTGATVRAREPKFPANCIIKDFVTPTQVEVWIYGVVKVRCGRGDYCKPPFPAGISMTCYFGPMGSNDDGLAVWADPMGVHPLIRTLEPVLKPGQVVYAVMV